MKVKSLLVKSSSICLVSSLVLANAYSDDIRIVPIEGGLPITCNYSFLTVGNGETPIIRLTDEGNGKACVVALSDGNGGGGPVDPEPPVDDGLPSTISPVGTLYVNNEAVSKPDYFSWKAVAGANKYLLRISKDGTPIKYIHVGIDSSVNNPNEIQEICANNDGGEDYCKYESPVSYAGGSLDLDNGTYTWSVRVKNSDDLNTTFDEVGEKSFTVAVQEVLSSASESASDFTNRWTSLYYNTSTGQNDYGTKEQLKTLIGRNPGEGYQVVSVGNIQKEVFIINRSRDVTTIIPSCVNGQDFSFSGAGCQVDIPFKRNEIYALRAKTKADANYSGAAVTKDNGQLYIPKGDRYKIVVSKFPGDVEGTRTDDFGGDCVTESIGGSFYIGLQPTGDVNNNYNTCIIPPDSNFYVNAELLDETSRELCDTQFCQFDIKISGINNPLE